MKTSTLYAAVLVLAAAAASGCLIDDTQKPRGQTSSPTASVPDSGGPARRQSADKTLNDAQVKPPADASLEEKSK